MNEWFFEGKLVQQLPNDICGFVYQITNITKNKKYIGKKQKQNNYKKPPLKGSKRKRKFKVQKWKQYQGSNIHLIQDIKDGDIYIKQILHLCKSKKQMTYLEMKQMFVRGVLQKQQYYNENIGGTLFRKDIK